MTLASVEQPCVMQLLPALEVGGVERGTIEIAEALVAAGYRAVVVSRGGRLAARLHAIGATHCELPIGDKHPRALLSIRPLRRLVREHRVDIVHARSRLPAWIGHRALAGIAAAERPAWVTTVHGPYTVNAYSRVMTSGDRVIAISEFIRAYIEQHYPQCGVDRIRVIPRGIDRDRYAYGWQPAPAWRERFLADTPAARDRRLLVIPGRITRWKGHADFIEMIARLIRDGLPVHGLIAGGAGDARAGFEQELRTLAATRGISQDVSFLGDRNDMREILALADIAYSLTLEPEAFGRTTAEAVSLGTPVIGYDHGGTQEILREVLPAGLVPVRDIRAAAARTAAFLAQPPAVASEHRFTLATMQARTLAVYRELLAARAHQRV